MKSPAIPFAFAAVIFLSVPAGGEMPDTSARKNNIAPSGFTALFNGADLAGWRGAAAGDPMGDTALPPAEQKRDAGLADIRRHWSVQDGELVHDGGGLFLATEKVPGDFELLVDYKAAASADGGVSARGCPQPLAGDSTGEAKWNRLRIIMVGARAWVWLNGKQTIAGVTLKNPFDPNAPVPQKGPIQLQGRGGETRWRDVFLREIGSDEANRILRGNDPVGFKAVFNARDFTGWAGAVDNYEVRDGAVVCKSGKGGAIYTDEEFGNFTARLEFKLPPAGNNGLAIRYPGKGNAAYDGMCECQVLDTEHPKYAKLDARQSHGSAYGMAAARRGYLHPTGEWNYEEVTVSGPTIRVELNGTVILDADLGKVTEFLDGKAHPGKDLARGHFGFAGHKDPVMFRNISIKPLD